MEYKVMSSPSSVYEHMLSDIRGAKREILLESYFYGNDKIGRIFLDELTKKAAQGVRVRLLLDAWGSDVKKKFFKKLIKAGGEVRFFRELRYAFHWFAANHERNHRKLLIIDGEITYIGSMNITNSCINWRELVLRLDGSLTNSFRLAFNHSWKRFNLFGVHKMKKIFYKGFEIVQDFPRAKRGRTERSYAKLIKRADREIFIETPYFVPSIRIRHEFKMALKRGVEIKIILPKNSDIKLMDIFRNRYLGKLSKMGVKIYYYPKTLHSKLLIVDENFFLLGSSNLDYRSFKHQYEINLLGRDRVVIDLLGRHFRGTLKKSRVFNYSIWKNRHRYAKILEKFIGPFREYF